MIVMFSSEIDALGLQSTSKHIWSILTEFSMFFREICASELNVEKLRHLEASMPITLCKLEMVFPPSLFDSMEHFPVHLAYEARWEARNNIDGCIRLRGFTHT
ncbi:hypothetical protein K1719_010167 [Acacia pycnantha]|nr:hypothetical protein K1719_010167 [Acacia pycnantha]